MVGALGVVEDEPIGELAVEEGEVGKEQVLVVVHEGLLDRSVESLDMGVHLRCLGVGVPTPDAALLKEPGEVGLKLAAVVGQQGLGGLRQCSKDKPHSRARAVWRACLEGSPTAKANCETGSMTVMM